MSIREITTSARIQAPPAALYRLIADYDDGHRRIIPRPPFVGLEVEQGGYGEGTVIRVRMRVLGTVRSYRAWITEPVPGRTLVETNDNGYVTTFTVDPLDGGGAARVTIATDLGGRGRVRGALEKVALGRTLRSTFDRELALLADAARLAGRARAIEDTSTTRRSSPTPHEP